MVHIQGGTYETGMPDPLPYAVVDTTGMAVVEAPESLCDAALAEHPGSSACWVQTDFHDPVVTLHEVSIRDYCIEEAPFPGRGVPNPPDGLTSWDASLLDEILSSGLYGPRRMCAFTEYELAVAGPRSNLRFVYGNEARPQLCPRSEETPIGSHPECRNPETGLYDYGAVIGQWVLTDDALVHEACVLTEHCRVSGGARLDEKNPDGTYKIRYLVAGGTHRIQTRQAPFTPHTWHDHGQVSGPEGCDDWGWDDGAVICASPDARYLRCAEEPGGEGCAELARMEASWSRLLTWCRGRRMTACLSRALSEVRGKRVKACPGGGGALGPGQGR
jgi:hypothetical protein